MKKLISICLVILFSGCSDRGEVFVQDKKILETKIECLKLVVFPPNEMIENTLNELYLFKKECNYKLIVSYKSSIVCNSNQNSEKKAHGMPKSYLRMEIKKDSTLKYTYYNDLDANLKRDDVKNGFEVIENDLKI